MRATRLYVYPIKSCGGLEVDRLLLDAAGLANDRVFVLVGEDGKHITQREAPQLAAIRVTLENQGFRVREPGGREIVLPYGGHHGRLANVRVHRDNCHGLDQGDVASQFFGNYLERPCRLLHVSTESPRLRHPEGVSHSFAVGFSDGFPLLVISQASLDDLNARLAEPVEMDRFRPNIVVEGSEAYAEDGWDRIVLDGMILEGAKLCVRCVITTTDQDFGRPHPQQEPLRTLARYRTSKMLGGPVFGRNYIHRTSGSIGKHAPIEIASFAFLPQFVDPTNGWPVAVQLLLLGVVTKVSNFAVLSTVALGAGTFGRWLARRPSLIAWQERFAGAVMVGLGLRLALSGDVRSAR